MHNKNYFLFNLNSCIIKPLSLKTQDGFPKLIITVAISMMNKKPGLIQIDADGLWVIFQHFGFKHSAPDDLLYASALPRFLDLFDAYGIKATFFVVGKDLLTASKVSLLRKAVEKGHEIANHTMNHAEGFSLLPLDKKKEEIEDAEKIIQDTLGLTPKGFRTPSNDVDSQTLKILEERGYSYDSSLLPTYFGPLLKKLKFSSLHIARKDNYLGKSIYGLAPLKPYHPSSEAIWKKGKMKIVEIPITTMPWLRLPFHTSFTLAAYHLGLGCGLFNLGYWLLSLTNLPLNFVFHTNELSVPIDEEKIKRQLGLNLPLETKQRICDYILGTIKKDFDILTTLEYSRKYIPD